MNASTSSIPTRAVSMNASTSLSLPEVATSSNENKFSSVSKNYNLDPYILDPIKWI
jgi:hypothetical protein